MKNTVQMTWRLAKSDFANKYAGNNFGVFWAFVQPIITIAIYVFVFQVAFKAAPSSNGYPYVLWLIAGIVPWFFFGESLMGATNVFVEYSYLVKKVVFPVYILPLVKVFSGLFVHLFFIAFGLVIYLVNGQVPGPQFIQIPYYLLCMVVLVMALSYVTASLVPFFKDFYQIVNLIVMIGMWLTPIMWNFDDMSAALGPWGKLFKLNPMFYVVRGYRDCFMRGNWFWTYRETLYFWALMIVLLLIGRKAFNSIRPHLADVL